MKNLIPRKRSLARRSTPLAVFAAALVVAVAAAAGLATQANAAPAVTAKLRNGGLTIKGTNAADAIALRLSVVQRGVLQVDVGDNGTADFEFNTADLAAIIVKAGERRRHRAHRRKQRRLQRHHPDDARAAATATTA